MGEWEKNAGVGRRNRRGRISARLAGAATVSRSFSSEKTAGKYGNAVRKNLKKERGSPRKGSPQLGNRNDAGNKIRP